MNFGVGVCRYWRSSIIFACIVPLILAMIIMDGSNVHLSWDMN